MSRLAKASPETRQKASDVLIQPLDITLNTIKTFLNPERVTLENLPADLVSEWKTPDGKRASP